MSPNSIRRGLTGMATGIVIAIAGQPAMTAPADPWQWLQNTYWYVPARYLLALASNPTLKSPIPVSDQTVYHIVQFAGGYFWGPTAVSYTRLAGSTAAAPACLQLVGSVTPEGKLHLTFTRLPSGTGGGSSGSPPTVGVGTMTPQQGAWTMENQMSTTAGNNLLLTHWAYMYECKPAAPCFAALPGVGVSIPDFLAPCSG